MAYTITETCAHCDEPAVTWENEDDPVWFCADCWEADILASMADAEDDRAYYAAEGMRI